MRHVLICDAEPMFRYGLAHQLACRGWTASIAEAGTVAAAIAHVRDLPPAVLVAHDLLPDGTVDTLLKPENKAMLQKVLTAHVVAGDWSAAAIAAQANNSPDGFYHFNAVSGDALSAQVKGGNVYIFDESGNAARVTIADVDQSNGVIHVVNKVLLPK